MLVNIQVVDLIIAWFHYRNVVSGNKLNALDYNNSKFIPSHSHNDQYFSSFQSLSHVQLFATPWTAACQASLSITNSQSLLKLIPRVGDAIQPSHPLSSPSPPALNLSQPQGLFQSILDLDLKQHTFLRLSVFVQNYHTNLNIQNKFKWHTKRTNMILKYYF